MATYLHKLPRKYIMSKINRYNFTKKYYPNYVVILLVKKKLYIVKDNKLVDFKYINKLKELQKNYIIQDNLDLYIKEYEDNKYLEYYLKYKLNNILNTILNKLRRDE